MPSTADGAPIKNGTNPFFNNMPSLPFSPIENKWDAANDDYLKYWITKLGATHCSGQRGSPLFQFVVKIVF